MIRKLITLFTFLAVMFTSFGYGWSFDKKHGNIELGDDPELTYVKVITIGVAAGLVSTPSKNISGSRDKQWREKKGSFLIEGMGCVVNNKYVITAAHVVHPILVTLAESPWNFYRMRPINIISRSIFISSMPDLSYSLKKGAASAIIHHLDINNDIAILELNAGHIFKPVEYDLSHTKYDDRGILFDEIKAGDAVAVVIRSRDENNEWKWGFEIGYGYVVSNMVDGVSKEEMPWFNMNDFTMDLLLKKGNSGSAIFAFEDGNPIIIGVARATNSKVDMLSKDHIKEVLSYATRIDFVKSVVEAE